MPRRSNSFQQLIRKIYEQITPHGASVTESALLNDRSSGEPREIDVLVELSLAGSTVRMAIECQDRSRTSDVGWIDSLIGKYRDLPVDKLIAISRSGFTASAKEKAGACNIEIKTLLQAFDEDWATIFERIRVARVKMRFEHKSYQFATTPPWPNKRPPSAIRIGEQSIEVGEWLRQAWATVRDDVAQSTEAEAIGNWYARGAGEHRQHIERAVTTDTTIFISTEGTAHVLSAVIINADVLLTYCFVEVTNAFFGDIGISTASDPRNELPDVMVVQRPQDALFKVVLLDDKAGPK